MKQFFRTWNADITVVFFTLVYLLLPTHNSSSDAYGYASYPGIGVHHFLYDAICVWMQHICKHNPVSALSWLKMINALFAGGILFVCVRILKSLHVSNVPVWILCIGATFGIMRFATENETYILPLFFALLATHVLHISKNRLQFACGFLLLGLAVLFHQSYAFWFLALSIRMIGKQRNLFWMPLIVVLICAGLIFVYTLLQDIKFTAFLLGELSSDTVELRPGLNNFIFTPISFIRSFVQIHGNIVLFFQQYKWLAAGMIVSAILMLYGFLRIALYLLKNRLPQTQVHTMWFRKTLGVVFILQLFFAWYSVGNAEFMVMLPVIFFLIAALKWPLPKTYISTLGAGLLIWNLSSAILPSRFIDVENLKGEWDCIERNEADYFVAKNTTVLTNYTVFYQAETGIDADYTAAWLDVFFIDSDSPAAFQAELNQVLKENKRVFTDRVGNAETLSRHSMLNQDPQNDLLSPYRLTKTDSFRSLKGWNYIYRIQLR